MYKSEDCDSDKWDHYDRVFHGVEKDGVVAH